MLQFPRHQTEASQLSRLQTARSLFQVQGSGRVDGYQGDQFCQGQIPLPHMGKITGFIPQIEVMIGTQPVRPQAQIDSRPVQVFGRWTPTLDVCITAGAETDMDHLVS